MVRRFVHLLGLVSSLLCAAFPLSKILCLVATGALLFGCATRGASTSGVTTSSEASYFIEVSGRVTNSLGHPVDGVSVAFYRSQPRFFLGSKQVDLHEFRTDKEGNYAGTFRSTESGPIEIRLTKSGYRGFVTGTGGGHHDWKLDRTFRDYNPSRLEHLADAELKDEMLGILSSPRAISNNTIRREIFRLEDHLRPVLEALAGDKRVESRAKNLLNLFEVEALVPLRLAPMSGRKIDPTEHPRPLQAGIANPNATVITATDLMAALKVVGRCLSPNGVNFSHEPPTYSRRGDKALVESSVVNGPSAGQGYELVFHRREGQWTLVLMRSTWIS